MVKRSVVSIFGADEAVYVAQRVLPVAGDQPRVVDGLGDGSEGAGNIENESKHALSPNIAVAYVRRVGCVAEWPYHVAHVVGAVGESPDRARHVDGGVAVRIQDEPISTANKVIAHNCFVVGNGVGSGKVSARE